MTTRRSSMIWVGAHAVGDEFGTELFARRTGLLRNAPNPGGPCGSSLCERTTVAANRLWAHRPPPFARRPGSYTSRGNPVGAHAVGEWTWHATCCGHNHHR